MKNKKFFFILFLFFLGLSQIMADERKNELDKLFKELKKDNLIAFKYCSEKGEINKKFNPNGSLENIAGIFNSNKNILANLSNDYVHFAI